MVSIRKAIGAIVYHGPKFLLVHKVKVGSQDVGGAWDFPKGGVEASDPDQAAALYRELLEETGASSYRIVRELPQKLCFEFDPFIKLLTGYDTQETTMYLVEYTGDLSDLRPNDKEITTVKFFTPEEIMSLLPHRETKAYFEQFITDEDKDGRS